MYWTKSNDEGSDLSHPNGIIAANNVARKNTGYLKEKHLVMYIAYQKDQ